MMHIHTQIHTQRYTPCAPHDLHHITATLYAHTALPHIIYTHTSLPHIAPTLPPHSLTPLGVVGEITEEERTGLGSRLEKLQSVTTDTLMTGNEWVGGKTRERFMQLSTGMWRWVCGGCCDG